jgi:uncharacterized protein (DUF1501 family)
MTAMNFDATLRTHAEGVSADLAAQDEAWGCSGWTRRRFLGGVGMVGAAALATQLVTSKASFATTPDTTGNTLVLVFLRGAADGLRILLPNSADLGLTYLRQVRPQLLPADSGLIALPSTSGWALNAAMKPLYDTLWATGELAFVPGVSDPGISRSHFQAQQYIEKGGSASATSGWLDRTLTQLGAGTTFRAVSAGGPTPLSMLGPQTTLAMDQLANFTFPGWDSIRPASQDAVAALYRGMSGPLGQDVPATLAALGTATTARASAGVQNGASYPSGNFSQALIDIATMLRAEVGLQVATVDLGGWDTHTDEARDLDAHLTSAAQSLAAFMTDLGPVRRKRVTVVVQTEFGRRVAMNASGGCDHGHGSLMWLLGGGLSGSGVFGKWTALSDATVDQGDVPGVNSPFDVLGEIVQKRLSAGSLASVFPGRTLSPLGVATTT